MEAEKLVEVTRGELVESIHSGIVAVVDYKGQLKAKVGNPGSITFIRSAAKPIQAIPVMESGACEHYNLTKEEIALFTASHSGETRHVTMVQNIMKKIGLSEEDLQCGSHWPLNKKSAKDLRNEGKRPSAFHCVCSGKHAGMLVLCKHRGWDIDEYYLPGHPVQREMVQAVADFASLKEEEVPIAVDGCGVPVFAVSIEKMAYIYARLGVPDDLSLQRQRVCAQLQEIMTSFPHLVGGEGRLATDLMQVTEGKVVAKDGAEGVFCAAVPSKGLGIACKIQDGSARGLGPVIIEALEQMGVLTEAEKKALANHSRTTIKNYRGENIGEIRSAFTLF